MARYRWLTVAVALAAVVAVWAGWRWWRERPRYPPEALPATATLELVTYEAAQAALFPNADEPMPPEFEVPTAPVAISDLLLALVYLGPDDQIYWAKRLLG